MAPEPALAGRPLAWRADLVGRGPPGALLRAARLAGISPGEAAREVLAGCPLKLAAAWLLCIARKRARLRSPGAVFRAGCQGRGEPSLADLVAADRLLRSCSADELPRGSMPAAGAARVVREVSGRWAANLAAGLAGASLPAWRRRRAELEARAAAERQGQLQRLRRLLPTLAGAERAAAERLLAGAA